MNQNRETEEMVCHPKHYASENKLYEPYKVINAWGCNFNVGSAIKYLARYQKKWNAIEDLEKAIQYIKFEIESLKEKTAEDATDTKNDVRSEVQDEGVRKCILPVNGKISIPENMTEIEDWAFYNCSGITRVTIPDSVTRIGGSAFSGCSGLTSVTIPNSVTTIGSFAFYNCSGLANVTIGNGVTSIGLGAFKGCRELKSVNIPDSVTYIGSRVFECCTRLASVVIGNRVKRIGYGAFAGCSGLTSVMIPERFKDELELIGINPSICRFYNLDKWTYMNI